MKICILKHIHLQITKPRSNTELYSKRISIIIVISSM